jgi:hypothetical protein
MTALTLVSCTQGDETVFFLDFTGPDGFPEQVANACRHVVVLDHHKTSFASLSGRTDLPKNLEVHIDMQRSGATLARDHFHSVTVCNDLNHWVPCLHISLIYRFEGHGYATKMHRMLTSYHRMLMSHEYTDAMVKHFVLICLCILDDRACAADFVGQKLM